MRAAHAGAVPGLRLVATAVALTLLGACAGSSPATDAGGHGPPGPGRSVESPRVASARPSPRLDGLPLVPRPFAYSTAGSTVVATAHLVRRAGPGQGPITVVTFNPLRTRLVLHAGFAEPVAGRAWHAGPSVGRARAALVAAFNSGFKMQDAHGGWVSEGRTVIPPVNGAASVVIYADGGTDIGAWGREVPQRGRAIASVRQNLQLLVDHGRPRHIRPTSQLQLDQWWGHAFLDAPLISRSALGVTANGALVWAAGTDITVAALAHALIKNGVVRALELDINAPLVRGFLYPFGAVVHSRHRMRHHMLPLVVGQTQLRHDPGATNPTVAPHCTYLRACSRDFFAVLTR